MGHRERITASFVILVLMATLLGCDSSSTTCVDSGPGAGLDPIEGRVRFRLIEWHDCSRSYCDPSIYLQMYTEKIYPCCNYPLESDVSVAHGIVSVRLDGVYKPGVCKTMPGPARGGHILELEPGEYGLRFSLGCDTDYYELTITEEALSVRQRRSNFMEPVSQLYWRYPHESMCYLCGTPTEKSWICDAFLDSLMATGRFVEFSFPDSGQIPYPKASDGHYYDMPGRYFRYTSEADFDTAGAVLERYSHEVISQHGGVGISLWNWRNGRYFSWLMEDD